MNYMAKVVKWFIQGAFEILHIAVMSAVVGTGLAYGALIGIGMYAALHGG